MQIARKVLLSYLSDKKYMFENIRVFDFTKKLNSLEEVKKLN